MPAILMQTSDPQAPGLVVGDVFDWHGRVGAYIVCGPVITHLTGYQVPVAPIGPEGRC